MIKWLARLIIRWFKLKPDAGEPVADDVYVVTEGHRIEKIAKSLSFKITPARSGDQNIEDVPVWAYEGTNPTDFNGGNTLGPLTVRVKANNPRSLELKVGMDDMVKEPDLFCGWVAGTTYAMRLDLLPDAVRLTVDGKSVEVKVAVPEVCTIGIGWPPQKRKGCTGAKITEQVWG